MRVPYRPEFTIQTVGQDYGTPFCLVSQAPVVRKMPCPVAFAERWYRALCNLFSLNVHL